MAEVTFGFRVEGRDDVHVFVGVFAGEKDRARGKAGQLCLANAEWDALRDHVLARADPLRLQVTEREPWPGE